MASVWFTVMNIMLISPFGMSSVATVACLLLRKLTACFFNEIVYGVVIIYGVFVVTFFSNLKLSKQKMDMLFSMSTFQKLNIIWPKNVATCLFRALCS